MVDFLVNGWFMFALGVLIGAISTYWYAIRDDGKAEREKAARRKAGAQKGAAKRKAKALEAVTEQSVVDPQMYGRKANGEGTWAG